VTLYEIRGPLFFGAAQKAISAIGTAAGPGKTVILNMTSVPAMDVTGLVALESALAKLRAAKAVVYVAGIQEQPRNVLRRAGMENRPGELMLFASVEEAIAQIKGAAPSLPAPTT
jgi:SulP family sulfate permease